MSNAGVALGTQLQTKTAGQDLSVNVLQCGKCREDRHTDLAASHVMCGCFLHYLRPLQLL
jgi:hypothetical protein